MSLVLMSDWMVTHASLGVSVTVVVFDCHAEVPFRGLMGWVPRFAAIG